MPEESPPDAELEVLALLNREGKLTVAEVRERLMATRPLTHSAVNTLLSRLRDRKLVSRRKSRVGKSYVYHIARKGRRVQGLAIRNLALRLFQGDPKAVVASLFENRAPTNDELDELQALLDSLRANRGSK